MRRLPWRRPEPPPPDPLTLVRRRHDQLDVLTAVAGQAVAHQVLADRAIRACGAPGIVPDQVGVELGGLLRTYSRLHHQIQEMDVDPSLSAPRRELQGLLSYHLHMLRDAGDLVFSGRPHARTERFRRELANGLGPHAQALVTLRDRLREQLGTTAF
jgi:hypothetical protein